MRDWQGMQVVVIGAARQGLALARYLAVHGAHVFINDRRLANELGGAVASLSDLPAGSVEWVFGGHPFEVLTGTQVLCPSGGVSLQLPLIQEARQRGILLSNDSQIFLEAAPCKVVGITGSAGKTTTTTLVGRMAVEGRPRQRGGDVWVGGNIGMPLIASVDRMTSDDLAVMELSSFQLEIMTKSPQTAVILNITPNHLDRHASMYDYTAAKKRILDFQAPGDIAVLGRDDPGAWNLAAGVTGRLVSFGLQQPATGQNGTFLQDGQLYLRDGAESTCLMPRSEILLRGEHNLLNVLAACSIAAAAGIPVEAMRAGVHGFLGVPHRLELVRDWKGARWYNDSIATAPERSIAAIRSFDEPLVLLAGGRDKNLPWEEFAGLALQRVKHLILFGEAAGKIEQAIEAAKTSKTEHTFSVRRCRGLQQAVEEADKIVEAGDVVLLSPGGTSFDEFRDFEERGGFYKMGYESEVDMDNSSETERPRGRSTRRPRPDRRASQGLAGFVSPAPREKGVGKVNRIFQAVEMTVDDPVEPTRPRATAHARPLHLGIDVPLILVICTLVVFGLLMVYSASWKLSLETSDSANSVFWRQFYYTLLGFALMVGLAFVNYHYWQKFAVLLLFVTLGLLVAVLAIHDEQLGATRSLFGGRVQPSELAKIMIVIYLAVWLFSKRDQLHQLSFGLGPLGVILGIVGVLIYLQPDLSATIMVFVLGGMMFFLGGGKVRQILFVMLIGTFFIWFVIATGISATGKNRVDSFIQGLHSPMDASPHVVRSMESFVKGGAFGVGIGKADSKLTVLPFPQTDSIFAVVGEETGVVGAALLVGLYVVLLWRGLVIARRAPDQLGTLLASGLILWVSMEALINMAVMIGLMPFAGNALPLMSAGGSNRVVTLVAMGIVLNVSRQSEKVKVEKERSFSAVVNLRRRDWRRGVPRSRRSTSSQVQD